MNNNSPSLSSIFHILVMTLITLPCFAATLPEGGALFQEVKKAYDGIAVYRDDGKVSFYNVAYGKPTSLSSIQGLKPSITVPFETLFKRPDRFKLVNNVLASHYTRRKAVWQDRDGVFIHIQGLISKPARRNTLQQAVGNASFEEGRPFMAVRLLLKMPPWDERGSPLTTYQVEEGGVVNSRDTYFLKVTLKRKIKYPNGERDVSTTQTHWVDKKNYRILRSLMRSASGAIMLTTYNLVSVSEDIDESDFTFHLSIFSWDYYKANFWVTIPLTLIFLFWFSYVFGKKLAKKDSDIEKARKRLKYINRIFTFIQATWLIFAIVVVILFASAGGHPPGIIFVPLILLVWFAIAGFLWFLQKGANK